MTHIHFTNLLTGKIRNYKTKSKITVLIDGNVQHMEFLNVQLLDEIKINMNNYGHLEENFTARLLNGFGNLYHDAYELYILENSEIRYETNNGEKYVVVLKDMYNNDYMLLPLSKFELNHYLI